MKTFDRRLLLIVVFLFGISLGLCVSWKPKTAPKPQKVVFIGSLEDIMKSDIIDVGDQLWIKRESDVFIPDNNKEYILKDVEIRNFEPNRTNDYTLGEENKWHYDDSGWMKSLFKVEVTKTETVWVKPHSGDDKREYCVKYRISDKQIEDIEKINGVELALSIFPYSVRVIKGDQFQWSEFESQIFAILSGNCYSCEEME